MMAVTMNEALRDWLDKDYTEREFKRVTERFPVPDVRRADSPVNIEDLQIGDRVEYLGTFVKVVCKAKTRYGQPFLLLDLADETGHLQGVVWTNDEMYVNRMEERIGKGKEAVVNGYVQEYPGGSGKLQMVISTINFEDVRVIVPDAHVLGMGHTVMQCILTIETLPTPFRDLALEGLEGHWDGILDSVDPESKRHKYYSGILTHMRWVLKALTFLYSKSANPSYSMMEIVNAVQPDMERFSAMASGGEGSIVRFPGSVDYLYKIVAKTQEAQKRPGDELSPYACLVAAVYLEIGKLVEDRRIGSTTFGAQTLLDTGEILGLPYAIVAPIQDLIVCKPIVYGVGELPRPSDAWILHFAQYLTDQIG